MFSMRQVCKFNEAIVFIACSRGMLGWIVVILVVWVGICWVFTYVALTKLNFLKR